METRSLGRDSLRLESPSISFVLQSKQFGPAGTLVLNYDAGTSSLAGRWMPPGPLLISVLTRKKVKLIRA